MAKFKEKITLVYNKTSGEFQEKSDEIKTIERYPDYTYITYKDNPQRYTNHTRNVIQQSLAGEIDLSASRIYISGELKPGITAVASYTTHYAIQDKDTEEIRYLPVEEVEIEPETSKGAWKQILPYLTAIAACKTVETDPETDQAAGGQRESFLSYQMKKIRLSKETVLTHYLTGKRIETTPAPETFIYPFSVNTSQKAAINQALRHKISIIQGPPGTGKTQSILNLIANLIYNGKSVGVVSNNNSAVENVKEKLSQHHYDFLIAHLGNQENQKRFFREPPADYTPPAAWTQPPKAIDTYKEKLRQTGEQIDRLLQAKEELARCKEELAQTQRESQEFSEQFGRTELPAGFGKLRKWDSGKLHAFKTVIHYFPESISLPLLPWYIYFVIRFDKAFLQGIKAQGAELSLALDSLIYQKRIHELNRQISRLQRLIQGSDLKALNARYTEISGILFRHSLYERYAHQRNPEFTLKSYKEQHFRAFVQRFPVIISTTHAILSSVGAPLDYIIIDESSQVDLITASLAFSVYRHVVIVGDSRQLSHIVSQEKGPAEALAKKYEIPPAYDYVKNNLITSLEQVYRQSIPKTLLKEHYRCHPLIIGFCNQKYYKGQLVVMTESTDIPCGDIAYPVRIARTEEGDFATRDKINSRQIAVIREEILPQFPAVNYEEIGIISPYRNQADRIATELCRDNGMESDTIHKYQGREKKKIFFTTVANEINSFIDSAEIINVAVSRAIDQFIMVMPHSYQLTHGSNIADLIRYIERWNPGGTLYSRIVSYFDLLNPGGKHAASLNAFRNQVKGRSKYQSENIIETLLRNILDENPACSGIEIHSGYPLYLLTAEHEGLSEREVSFCENRLSHVDFLLINRCDNSFVLAIEVDGYTYHSTAKQQERDAIKDKALALNGIPLLRLSTRGENEKEKITETLQNLIFTGTEVGTSHEAKPQTITTA